MEVYLETTQHSRKKTRRGKRKYRRRLLSTTPYCGCSMETSGFNGNGLEKYHMMKARRNKVNRRRTRLCLRPLTSPSAPHNSTQFLIEDRLTIEQESKIINSPSSKQDDTLTSKAVSDDSESFFTSDFTLYPTNKSYLSKCTEGFNWKTSPAFSDVDYKYVPVQDEEDRMIFMQKDFEEVYLCTRENELMKKDKMDLVIEIQKLYSSVDSLRKLADIQDQRTKYCPPVAVSLLSSQYGISSLLSELNELKVDNLRLAEENEKLKLSS